MRGRPYALAALTGSVYGVFTFLLLASDTFKVSFSTVMIFLSCSIGLTVLGVQYVLHRLHPSIPRIKLALCGLLTVVAGIAAFVAITNITRDSPPPPTPWTMLILLLVASFFFCLLVAFLLKKRRSSPSADPGILDEDELN